MMRHMDPSLVGSSTRSQRDEVTFSFSYHFSNIKLLTSLHLIFQEENSLQWEEEVEDTSDGAGHDSEEEEEEEQEQEEHEEEEHEKEGHYEGEEEQGDGSALGSASSRRYRTSHLIRPPIAPHEDSRIVIVPCGDA
jgi:hypothetical protein